MKNTISLLLFAAISLYSCKKAENVEKTSDISGKTQIAVDSVALSDSLKAADSLSMKYTAKMLVFPGIKEKPLLDSIYFFAPKLKDFTSTGIQTYLNSEKTSFFDSVRKENKAWVSSLSSAQQWYNNSEMKLVSKDSDFMHIRYFGSSFMGGAHDNYFFSERVFDLQKHKRLLLSEITSMDREKLSQILMTELDKSKGNATSNGERIANRDMLLVDKIPVTENFYFDQHNLYFHYSPYEITAFAAGDVTIPVPWKDLGATLNPDFKKRMNL